MGNAGAKPTLTQVIEISGEDVAGVIQSTIVARMQALPDFLSEDAADTRRRSGKLWDGCRENTGRNRGKSHRAWPGVFRLPRFPADVRGPCVDERLCGKRLTCPYPMPHLEQDAGAGARIRRVYRRLKQRTPHRTGQKPIVPLLPRNR